MKILTSLVNSAILRTEGANADSASAGNARRLFKSRNVAVIFENDDTVTIDAYVDVEFGYCVSEVACNLQNAIIADVGANSTLNVNKVNIIVNDVIVN